MKKDREFAHFFRETHQKFSRYYHLVLASADISLPQYMLLCLLTNQGTATMTELSTRLALTKPAITNLVDRLAAKAMLRRSPDCADRRICRISIRPKGKKLVDTIQTQSLDLMLSALTRMSGNEQSAIINFYRSIITTMDERVSTYGK